MFHYDVALKLCLLVLDFKGALNYSYLRDSKNGRG